MSDSLMTIKRRLLLGLTALASSLLSACSWSPVPSDYASEKPSLVLESYFNGNLTAHGIFTDRSGKVARRFTVDMKCSWMGDSGVLDEDFTYSDGKKERRIWRLKKIAEGQYVGTADDVIGTAVGQTSGNAFQWKYTLSLPVDGRVYEVQFDDWMYLIDDRVMINKARMSKFGVFLGEVTLVFNKH